MFFFSPAFCTELCLALSLPTRIKHFYCSFPARSSLDKKVKLTMNAAFENFAARNNCEQEAGTQEEGSTASYKLMKKNGFFGVFFFGQTSYDILKAGKGLKRSNSDGPGCTSTFHVPCNMEVPLESPGNQTASKCFTSCRSPFGTDRVRPVSCLPAAPEG